MKPNDSQALALVSTPDGDPPSASMPLRVTPNHEKNMMMNSDDAETRGDLLTLAQPVYVHLVMPPLVLGVGATVRRRGRNRRLAGGS